MMSKVLGVRRLKHYAAIVRHDHVMVLLAQDPGDKPLINDTILHQQDIERASMVHVFEDAAINYARLACLGLSDTDNRIDQFEPQDGFEHPRRQSGLRPPCDSLESRRKASSRARTTAIRARRRFPGLKKSHRFPADRRRQSPGRKGSRWPVPGGSLKLRHIRLPYSGGDNSPNCGGALFQQPPVRCIVVDNQECACLARRPPAVSAPGGVLLSARPN